jgi:hypothetical protein
MGSNYAGNSANYPATIYVPDDVVDPLTTASIDPAIEQLADRTANLSSRLGNPAVFSFTSFVGASTILAETSAGPPCELQTNLAHGLQTGMSVVITGATGDTTINGGPFVVTVIDSTHFTIPITGAGGYTASSGTVTPCVPVGVTSILIDGCGGGGGGEGGCGGGFGTPGNYYCQGGGGSGAPRTVQILPCAPGDLLSISPGGGGAGSAGGTGGNAGTSGAPASAAPPASDGGASFVLDSTSGAQCLFAGGRGAGTGTFAFAGATSGELAVAPGAVPGQNAGTNGRLLGFTFTPNIALGGTITNLPNTGPLQPSQGGAAVLIPANASGLGYTLSQNGADSNNGYLGGAAGSPGTTAGSTAFGGSGGGGGGAGGFGGGGQAGSGGNGNTAANGTVGLQAPAVPSTHYGSGGGGGGGGGVGQGSGNAGGAGGGGANGAGGFLRLSWVQLGVAL